MSICQRQPMQQLCHVSQNLNEASRMNKQIVATSTASLSNGEKIAVRKCSEPEDDLLQIYDTLKVDHIPIKARKFVWTQNADIKRKESWKSGG